MKFNEKWLREWVNPAIDTQALAEQLTLAGLEVDGIAPAAGDFSQVVVGEIVSCHKHPDADKLQVCAVDVGEAEPLQIVCGAPNAREGLKAPVALVGAVLPGDFKIRKSRLRGVESHGMLCSAVELGLSDDHSGLLELPADAPVGMDLRDYLDLDDAIIDVDLTPNRADCFSLRGLAGEVAALNHLSAHGPECAPVAPDSDEIMPVEVQAVEDCPRYLSRVISGIDPQAETPLWMSEKLRRCGLRSIHPVVDVTNYVMLELGQPMHAFDRQRIGDNIVVRRARGGEKITLLDGKEVVLDDSYLLIGDNQRPLAIAGVMGGEDSGVGESSTDIVLESAWFRPSTIMGKSRTLGIHTESAHRFERGVDPQLQSAAMERATALLLEIAGGKPGPVNEVAAAEHLPQPEEIDLPRKRISQILGVELADDEIQGVLERLNMQVTGTDTGWRVMPPSHRVDLEIAEDLIEEIARVVGYERLPSANLSGELRIEPVPESVLAENRLRDALVDRGYLEAINYSFVPEKLMQHTRQPGPFIELANPLNEDMAIMRPVLFPALLENLGNNLRRQQADVRLFELGTVFDKQPGKDSPYHETQHLAGVRSGWQNAETWAFEKKPMDFFDIKGDIEAVLTLNRKPYAFRPANSPWLHPGRSAEVIVDDQLAGWVGQIHPQVAKALGIKKDVYAFELDATAIRQSVLPRYEDVSKFPTVRRDLAVVVDDKVSFDEVRRLIQGIAGPLLKQVLLFDVYTGESVESGCKSLAIGLILQEKNRTLSDKEVDKIVGEIVSSLKDELRAEIRGSE